VKKRKVGKDPTATHDEARTVRGGGWFSYGGSLRSAHKPRSRPHVTELTLACRLLLIPKESPA
jgi:hypothetical protein